MTPWLHAAVTLGALAAWVTIVLVIAGLWPRKRRDDLVLPSSELPTEHAPYRDQAEN